MSPEPDTSLPSGEKATDQTGPEWPLSGSPCGAPVAASQSRIVLSPEPDVTSLPSGEKATDLTESEWPSSGSPCGAPVAVSQSRTVPSPEPDATSLPSGEKATEETGGSPCCPAWFETLPLLLRVFHGCLPREGMDPELSIPLCSTDRRSEVIISIINLRIKF